MRQVLQSSYPLILERSQYSPLQNLRYFESSLQHELLPHMLGSGQENELPLSMIVSQPVLTNAVRNRQNFPQDLGLTQQGAFTPLQQLSQNHGNSAILQRVPEIQSPPLNRYPLINNAPQRKFPVSNQNLNNFDQKSNLPAQQAHLSAQQPNIQAQLSHLQAQKSYIPPQSHPLPIQRPYLPAQYPQPQDQKSPIPNQFPLHPLQKSHPPLQTAHLQVQNSHGPIQLPHPPIQQPQHNFQQPLPIQAHPEHGFASPHGSNLRPVPEILGPNKLPLPIHRRPEYTLPRHSQLPRTLLGNQPGQLYQLNPINVPQNYQNNHQVLNQRFMESPIIPNADITSKHAYGSNLQSQGNSRIPQQVVNNQHQLLPLNNRPEENSPNRNTNPTNNSPINSLQNNYRAYSEAPQASPYHSPQQASDQQHTLQNTALGINRPSLPASSNNQHLPVYHTSPEGNTGRSIFHSPNLPQPTLTGYHQNSRDGTSNIQHQRDLTPDYSKRHLDSAYASQTEKFDLTDKADDPDQSARKRRRKYKGGEEENDDSLATKKEEDEESKKSHSERHLRRLRWSRLPSIYH